MNIKRSRMRLAAILALLAMLLSLGGCSIVAEPSARCAEKYWERDADDLQTMVQWLQNTGYQFFSFDRFDDFALADLEHIPLDEIDETIRPTLERLFDKRYQVMILDREENSIQFEFWSSFQQQGCGLLYAIDPAKPAKTQYMMQCEPLTEAQWYYYFTDANEWRVEQTRGADESNEIPRRVWRRGSAAVSGISAAPPLHPVFSKAHKDDFDRPLDFPRHAVG